MPRPRHVLWAPHLTHAAHTALTRPAAPPPAQARVRKETGELRKLQTEAESAGQLAQDLLAPVQAGAKAVAATEAESDDEWTPPPPMARVYPHSHIR